ncbi:hypothetical protein Aperf_G00000050268 [Anoplocephala perfoliata]
MESDSDEELDLFLKYVDLPNCKETLKQAGVYSFKDIKVVSKEALKLFLPAPAAERIIRKRSKFDKQVNKKSKYPPMKDFLVKLNLENIQEDLNKKLQITRVEHFRDATKEDLLPVVGKDVARRIMEAYKMEKSFIKRLIFNTEQAAMKFGNKVYAFLSPKGPSKQAAITAPPESTSTVTVPHPDLEEVTRKVSSPAATQTGELQHINMISTERLSQTQFEKYQHCDVDDDKSIEITASAPPGSDTGDNSLSTSPDEWNKFSVSELNESMKPLELQQNRSRSSSPPAPKSPIDEKMSNLTLDECEEDCPDSYVMEYFLSAREEDSFQYFDDVSIEQNDIEQVRANLTCLMDLSDDDICDALRFVHSEQLSSHSFFDRPPPQIKSNKFLSWHYLQAARVLTLRKIYAIATHLNFEECCEALRSCGWSFMDTLESVLK